jgi:hypothetical protein
MEESNTEKMKSKEKRKERRGRRREKLREREEEMDWEVNLVGVDKLLYPGEESSSGGEYEDEELLNDSQMEEEDEEAEVRKKQMEDEIARRMRIQARTEAFIERKRVEAEQRFNSFMDKLQVNKLEYEVIRRTHAEELKLKRADGLENAVRSVGSFVNSMDGRILTTGVSTSLQDKKSTTTSFNPISLECYGCAENHAGKMWRSKGDSGELTAEAILLTDQSYPPAFPTGGKQSCLKVVRREDASLMDLVNELVGLTRGKEVHKQTIVMIHSLSHMARVGTEGYAEDLLMAASKLKALLG